MNNDKLKLEIRSKLFGELVKSFPNWRSEKDGLLTTKKIDIKICKHVFEKSDAIINGKNYEDIFIKKYIEKNPIYSFIGACYYCKYCSTVLMELSMESTEQEERPELVIYNDRLKTMIYFQLQKFMKTFLKINVHINTTKLFYYIIDLINPFIDLYKQYYQKNSSDLELNDKIDCVILIYLLMIFTFISSKNKGLIEIYLNKPIFIDKNLNKDKNKEKNKEKRNFEKNLKKGGVESKEELKKIMITIYNLSVDTIPSIDVLLKNKTKEIIVRAYKDLSKIQISSSLFQSEKLKFTSFDNYKNFLKFVENFKLDKTENKQINLKIYKNTYYQFKDGIITNEILKDNLLIERVKLVLSIIPKFSFIYREDLRFKFNFLKRDDIVNDNHIKYTIITNRILEGIKIEDKKIENDKIDKLEKINNLNKLENEIYDKNKILEEFSKMKSIFSKFYPENLFYNLGLSTKFTFQDFIDNKKNIFDEERIDQLRKLIQYLKYDYIRLKNFKNDIQLPFYLKKFSHLKNKLIDHKILEKIKSSNDFDNKENENYYLLFLIYDFINKNLDTEIKNLIVSQLVFHEKNSTLPDIIRYILKHSEDKKEEKVEIRNTSENEMTEIELNVENNELYEDGETENKRDRFEMTEDVELDIED